MKTKNQIIYISFKGANAITEQLKISESAILHSHELGADFERWMTPAYGTLVFTRGTYNPSTKSVECGGYTWASIQRLVYHEYGLLTGTLVYGPAENSFGKEAHSVVMVSVIPRINRLLYAFDELHSCLFTRFRGIVPASAFVDVEEVSFYSYDFGYDFRPNGTEHTSYSDDMVAVIRQGASLILGDTATAQGIISPKGPKNGASFSPGWASQRADEDGWLHLHSFGTYDRLPARASARKHLVEAMSVIGDEKVVRSFYPGIDPGLSVLFRRAISPTVISPDLAMALFFPVDQQFGHPKFTYGESHEEEDQ